MGLKGLPGCPGVGIDIGSMIGKTGLTGCTTGVGMVGKVIGWLGFTAGVASDTLSFIGTLIVWPQGNFSGTIT